MRFIKSLYLAWLTRPISRRAEARRLRRLRADEIRRMGEVAGHSLNRSAQS